jgi:hypothetical protein
VIGQASQFEAFMKRNLLMLLTAGIVWLALIVQSPAGTIFEEIIVRINNDIITKSDYEKSKELIKKELQKSLDGAEFEKALAYQEKNLLKTMIDEQLLVQKALDLACRQITRSLNISTGYVRNTNCRI